jgi:hypothetical protein
MAILLKRIEKVDSGIDGGCPRHVIQVRVCSNISLPRHIGIFSRRSGIPPQASATRLRPKTNENQSVYQCKFRHLGATAAIKPLHA